MRVISGTKRKFQANWIKENPWLRYSENTDSVYCVYCVLFAPKEKANLTLSFLSPVNNWSNMSQLIKRHLLEKSKHHEYMRMADDFMKVFQGKSPSIASSLSKAHQESIAKNRFCSVVDRIYLLEAIEKTTAVFMQFCIPWPKQTQS